MADGKERPRKDGLGPIYSGKTPIRKVPQQGREEKGKTPIPKVPPRPPENKKD